MVTRSMLIGSLCAALSLTVGACANSPFGATLERSIQADPRLTESAGALEETVASSTPTPMTLPANFPDAIPLYPDADLVSVSPMPAEGGVTGTQDRGETTDTIWSTADDREQVQEFYQTRLAEDGWQLRSPTTTGAIAAERQGVEVEIVFSPSSPTATSSPSPRSGSTSPASVPPTPTEFTLSYQVPGPTPAATGATSPGEPTPPRTGAEDAALATQSFTDIGQAPEELQPYIEDLGQLGVLALGEADGAAANQFKPNQSITRREYARWLLATNNRIYRDRPANKIRLGVDSDQPAFQDLPKTDVDFATIQGLAEAGIVPSPLSGATTTVTFRPNAPLTREDMLLWKLPLDLRRTLPNATVQAVQDTWGFQDAARIDPLALRAVLADYQAGDLSNIRRAFGFTTLFQPDRPVTRAEAAATLWYFGAQGDGLSAQDALTDGPASTSTSTSTDP